MVWPLEAVFDRDITGGEIDQSAGNEKRRNPPRAFFLQHQRGLGDAFNAADARTDHGPSHNLVFVRLGTPARILYRLFGSCHRIDDEVIDLALFLRLHPMVWIVGAVAAVAARDDAGDLASNVGYLEGVDALDPALACDDALPRRFNATSQRRDHAEPGDDDASHNSGLWPGAKPSLSGCTSTGNNACSTQFLNGGV